MNPSRYTFGDNEEASARLRLLAELYEPQTRELLLRGGVEQPRLAIDLGCGPGWTTRLLHETLHPERTVGLDASERYVAEARRTHDSLLEFEVHDVTRTPFPVAAPNAMLCRFLLTHLREPGEVLARWAGISAPGCVLFIHETESMEAEHPALCRYYELVAELQRHYGQTLEVGALLEDCVAKRGWRVVESSRLELRKPANAMAGVHLANLRTWRQDEYARKAFDAGEIDALEASLMEIAGGALRDGIVINGARQIIARRVG
ncbi:MAG: class I SAM-dependent methyltransferase [Candidatus Acidiferrales bacterium]